MAVIKYMPIFEDDAYLLSRELKTYNPNSLPPFISLLITGFSFIVALVVTLFFIFPVIIAVFNIGRAWAFFISLGSFIIIHFIMAHALERLVRYISAIRHDGIWQQ